MLFTSGVGRPTRTPVAALGGVTPGTDALAVPAGEVLRMSLGGPSRQVYYLYVPRRIRPPARVFVTVHGISRNAREHAERFASFAEEAGVILVAPRFARQRFPNYQRLAANAKGRQPDQTLDEILGEVRDRLRLPAAPLYLFGYSGGGQFVHRYAMAHPTRVARAVVGAAGWYTFPDPRSRYPRGLRTLPGGGPLPRYPDFLRVPMAVIVGSEDVARDPALNQSPRIDRQQGADRCERGRRWVAAMQQAARAQGLTTDYRFQTLPGIGHDFTIAMVSGGMGKAVFAYLFAQPGEAL